MLDDGDVVRSVIRMGPHGLYESVYSKNAVLRYFVDAHSVAQKAQRKQEGKPALTLHAPNSVYGGGKREIA